MATVEQKARLWFHESISVVTDQIIIWLEYRNCRSSSLQNSSSTNTVVENFEKRFFYIIDIGFQLKTVEETMLELECRLPLFSLHEMSLLRITTTLCNNRQLLQLIMKCKFLKDFDNRLYIRKGAEWAAVQAMANELISQICNCTKLNKMIVKLVWPVYYRIMMWKSIYDPFVEHQFPLHFCWTDQGKVDTIRTVRYIIGNKNISIRRRFVLACSACLGEEIREMWRGMSNDDKMYFFAENGEKIRPLLLFWAHTMKGTDDVLEQFLNEACLCAYDNGLLEAIKYLFAISTEVEREEVAYTCMFELIPKFNGVGFLEENEIEMVYFLYFKINKMSRGLISDRFMLEMSLSFQFSEREHFSRVLAERLQSASDRAVLVLLYMVFFSYHLEVIKDEDYGRIFIDIWRNIPASTKNYITSTNLGGHFLTVLIRDDFPFLVRKGAFKKIAQLASSVSKPSTAVVPFGFHHGKWEILNFLIEEGIATNTFLEAP
ncbi:hypothetical protein AVEN_59682-1 [Araneus ventricosus]|uniref:Uncharacterized protein n=1 Tax=Araneus ventricosus TaxID=182803 RepID=A0A4Y2BML2_ARAVE|nr:hypothetical protein AVEN_59682-1 [Araneus ventricosus]